MPRTPEIERPLVIVPPIKMSKRVVDKAKKKAKREGKTISAIQREAVERYANGEAA